MSIFIKLDKANQLSLDVNTFDAIAFYKDSGKKEPRQLKNLLQMKDGLTWDFMKIKKSKTSNPLSGKDTHLAG